MHEVLHNYFFAENFSKIPNGHTRMLNDYINQMEGRELITEIPYDACILYYDPHWNVYHIDMSMGGTQILRFKGAGKITKAAAAAVNV